ncbi:hypothetical protein CHRY9390_01714 [Chryseobacterium aquaeductus]|uniref:Uncharacterized protein n=1 Tax=Chryseobacterium aquaeductus TaxID=2675056 RepID=A0A9N8QSH7_9FLAO|nr:hypothetical protein [Chryseobacterium aquaeductus]CAA7331034.1 hypothetical protein CHRY9390_01714 [Chryseobacterium potabilaquae]CAD7807781.1 hypothetical protein CHRY9390_01714 [Chryseobacterium aquaeductus]
MKNLLFGILLGCFALMACRSDEDSIQKIDQIMNIYIQDASGKDLLIPDSIGSFTSVTMNDMLAATDNAPVSFSPKTSESSRRFLEYIAGATRQLQSGEDSDDRIYRSQILVALTKKLTDTTFSNPVNDTLEILYRWTPNVFEVSKVNYNQQLIFTKVPDQPNNVTIIK